MKTLVLSAHPRAGKQESIMHHPLIAFGRISIFILVLTVIYISAQATTQSTNSSPTVSGSGGQRPLGGCTPDNWDTTFTSNGINGQVNAIVMDGAGNYYVGGSFTSVQGFPAAGIAKWNGTSWSALGSGISGSVYAIAISGSDIYVGGDFNSPVTGGPARNVAKWNGSSWSALGSGLGGGTHYVKSVAVYNGEAYFGGNFTTSDGSPFSGITKWDGTAYQSAGSLLGDVTSFAVSGGFLYAGGDIATAPGASIGIAKYDGTTWSELGTSANTSIKAITFSGTDMYVVGSRIVIAGQQDSQVSKFDGTTWTRLGYFSTGGPNAVAVVGSDLYVGGYIPSNPFNHLAKWNGSTWTGVGSGVSGGTSVSRSIAALLVSGNTLFVGGNFAIAGGLGAKNIATVTSGAWAAFEGTGLDAAPSAIAVSGTDVYVGGSFSSAGPVTARGIAKWNSVANSWSALGSGSNGSVASIAVAGGNVYAGGSFSQMGGINASNIAVWNGQTWATLGSGVNGTVTAIVVRGNDVYVGGSFTSAGGITTSRIAKWNGTSWSGYSGNPLPNTVTGLGFIGNDMYVSSNTTAFNTPNYLLKFDGTTWTGLADGMGGHGVSSLAVLGTNVYITGGFSTVGGVAANQVAKWDGSTWSALGGGLPPGGFGLGGSRVGTSGTDIIAVGDFTVATGGPAEHVARWNGSNWAPLGNGLDATGSTVFAAGGNIYVGGAFSRAGCNISPYLARWRETVWTGMTNNDWHTASNWGSGSVPQAGAGVTILSNNVSITSVNVTLSSLTVADGRTLTVGSGRTLTVTGNLDLSNGNLVNWGTLVVNGDLILNSGTMIGPGSTVINGSLYLNGGKMVGFGPVSVTSCRIGAIVGGSSSSFISSPLTRCVDSSGTYRFPVGIDPLYLPVDLSNVVGSSLFTVGARNDAYPGAAVGLPTNRLQRWWSFQSGGISQAEISVRYLNSEVVGAEESYRAYTIASGTATLIPTILDRAADRAIMPGMSVFASLTLAEVASGTADLLGRVTTMTGRGAAGVTVTLTDSDGVSRLAVTNPFGYYRFMGVSTFRFYTVSVKSKKFRFAVPTQTVQFDQTLTNINFLSNSH